MYLQMRPQAQGQSRSKPQVQIVDPSTLFGGEILFVADLASPRLEDRGGFYAGHPPVRMGRRWAHVGLWVPGPGRMFSISETSQQMSFWMEPNGLFCFGADGKPARIAQGWTYGKPTVVTIEKVNDRRIHARLNGRGGITAEPFQPDSHRENVILFSARGIARQTPYQGEFIGGVWIDRVLTNKERLGLETFYRQLGEGDAGGS